jgi:hypothetical protein
MGDERQDERNMAQGFLGSGQRASLKSVLLAKALASKDTYLRFSRENLFLLRSQRNIMQLLQLGLATK